MLCFMEHCTPQVASNLSMKLSSGFEQVNGCWQEHLENRCGFRTDIKGWRIKIRSIKKSYTGISLMNKKELYCSRRQSLDSFRLKITKQVI